MDKTITIDGKRVTFRKTGGTAMRYKQQFNRELNADLRKIFSVYKDITQISDGKDGEEAAINAFLGVETEWLYEIVFIMAQQADSTITDMISWLDSFDSFNVWYVFMQLMDMLQSEMAIHPKNA